MNSPITMADVINIGASRRQMPKTCPFCNQDPPLAHLLYGTYVVACENDDCHATAQATGKTVEEAWANWNRRLG